MEAKQKFEKQVMKDVLEVNKFEEYISFVRDEPEYSARRLKHNVDVYLLQNRKFFCDKRGKVSGRHFEQCAKITNIDWRGNGNGSVKIGAEVNIPIGSFTVIRTPTLFSTIPCDAVGPGYCPLVLPGLLPAPPQAE